jgi:DNA-binding protein H-NS
LIAERRHQALEELREKASMLGFTADDLVPKKPRNGTSKYRDNNGNTWGGKGKRPAWITAIVDGGGNIEDYRA